MDIHLTPAPPEHSDPHRLPVLDPHVPQPYGPCPAHAADSLDLVEAHDIAERVRQLPDIDLSPLLHPAP